MTMEGATEKEDSRGEATRKVKEESGWAEKNSKLAVSPVERNYRPRFDAC